MRSWLKEKRLEHGYTMKQLGEKLGISESYYSTIEAGTRQKKMDIMLVSGLSGALDVPVSQIAEWESMPDPEPETQ